MCFSKSTKKIRANICALLLLIAPTIIFSAPVLSPQQKILISYHVRAGYPFVTPSKWSILEPSASPLPVVEGNFPEDEFKWTINGDSLNISDYLNRQPITGLLIAKDGVLLYEKYQYNAKNGRLLLLTTGQNPLFSDHIIGLKKKSDLENQNASLIRRNISQLTSELICSVLGNCLTLYESKKLYLQLQSGSTPAESEYEIHGKLVSIASVKGQAARVIHKFIDEKFQLDVRKFSKISNANEIEDIWNESLQLGNISGTFWASITHPLCSNKILKEIYGYVHMRTHFVGSLDKFELKKYDEFQVQSTGFDKEIQLLKINHFEQTHSRDVKIQNLEKKVQDQQLEIVSAKSLISKPSKPFLNLEIENNNLTNENSKFTNRVSSLEENLKKIKAQQIQSDSEIKSYQSANKDLLQEVETLELLIRSDFESNDLDHNGKLAYLKGRTFLYVGGTHQLAINIKNVASKMEFQCLFHDGGVEDRIGLLIGLINQAEIIFFPMNHVSHAAVSIIKSQADKTNKVYAPLKSSGLSTFLVALYAEGAL